MRLLLKWTVSIALLALAIYLLDWKRLGLALESINPWVFAAAVMLALSLVPVLGVRWYFMVRGLVPLPLRTHLHYYLYATFLNSFTPANLGGDVYRVLILSTGGATKISLTVEVVRERLIGLLSYLVGYLICLTTTAVTGPAPGIFVYIGYLILAAVAGILIAPFILHRHVLEFSWIARRARLRKWLEHLGQAISFRSWNDFIRLMTLSFVALALWITTVQLISVALGLKLSWFALGLTVILTEIVRLLPITVQGIGLREGSFAVLLSQMGCPASTAFILGAVSYLALSCSILLCGLAGTIPTQPVRNA
jgi:uncharacterized protein (TIRG00374 family)